MPANVPPVGDERDALLRFLAQQRDGVKFAAYGLTDDQARLAPTAGSLTIGGLVKHLTYVERNWMGMILLRDRRSTEEYLSGFNLGADETLADAMAQYEQAARETTEIVESIPDLGQAVPVPKGVPWFPQDVEAWSVRWVLLHLIEETARHAGHADIVRESLDGASALSLMAAAEDWPATPWMQPWRPPAPDE